MVSEWLIPIGVFVALMVLLAIMLAIAHRKLYVFEDPRIDQVEELLPHANCGACGEPGCRAFAEKLVAGNVLPAICTVSSSEEREHIAAFLGIEAGKAEKRVARLLCAGGKQETHHLAEYKGGLSTCRGEATVAGGPKACTWGCLGLGDCVKVCDFDALFLNDDGLPQVIPDKCTACGDCVEVCPKNLFEIMPVSQKLIVQCKSLLQGDMAKSRCSVACTACAKCVADAMDGVIEIKDNLAVINYQLNHLTTPGANDRCATNAIVWVEGAQFQEPEEVVLPLGRVEKMEES